MGDAYLRRYLISQHPEVEAKLVAELDQAGLLVTKERPHPRDMVYGDLSSLNYLNWVCKVLDCRRQFLSALVSSDVLFVSKLAAPGCRACKGHYCGAPLASMLLSGVNSPSHQDWWPAVVGPDPIKGVLCGL